MSFFSFLQCIQELLNLEKREQPDYQDYILFQQFSDFFLLVRSLFQVFLCNIKRNDFYQTIFCICLQLLCLWARKYGASNCFVASYLHFNIQPAYHIVGFVHSCPKCNLQSFTSNARTTNQQLKLLKVQPKNTPDPPSNNYGYQLKVTFHSRYLQVPEILGTWRYLLFFNSTNFFEFMHG